MKKILYTTCAFVFLIQINYASAYTFTQSIYLGSKGEEVRQLQIFLNKDPRTQITTTGIGSPGNESDYFGLKTRDAVIKLQNIYKDEILTPQNLTAGTGFVGTRTIALLNRLQDEQTNFEKTQTRNEETRTSTSTQQTTRTEEIRKNIENNIKIGKELPKFYVSQTTIRPKTVLYVGSETKLADLDFFVGDYQMKKSCRHSEYACAFRVRLDPGEYILRTSNPDLGKHKITILERTEKIPEVSVNTLSLTSENLIKGKFFSDTVKIFTMFGAFESETQNDSFILKFPKEYIKNASSTTEGLFYIQNENGLMSDVRNIKYEK